MEVIIEVDRKERGLDDDRCMWFRKRPSVGTVFEHCSSAPRSMKGSQIS
jgi:hypothetical protein